MTFIDLLPKTGLVIIRALERERRFQLLRLNALAGIMKYVGLCWPKLCSGVVLVCILSTTAHSILAATNPDLWGATSNGSVTVAVGSGGAIFVTDRYSWKRAYSNATEWLLGVAYGNDRFVAVGENGVALTSRDGVTWAKASTGVSGRLQNVTFGNGLFVAIGFTGEIVTSPDGANWTSRESGTRVWLRGITFGGGLFVASGEAGTLLTSTDTVTWIHRDSATTAGLDGVVYAAIKVVETDMYIPHEVNVPTRFVAVGQQGVAVMSLDGIHWVAGNTGTSEWLRAVGVFRTEVQFVSPYAELFDRLYAVGENGVLIYSDDGLSWKPSSETTTNRWWSSTFGSPTSGSVPALRAVETNSTALYAYGSNGDVCSRWEDNGMGAHPQGNRTSLSLDLPNAQPRRFLSISTRGVVHGDDQPLIAGFAITGDFPQRVLLRGAGPSLGAFGVSDPLSDPQIELFDSNGTKRYTNDNWSVDSYNQGNNSDLVANASRTAYAFPFPAGSRDSALVVALSPGVYTVRLSGVNNASGTALVEVYDLP